MTAGLTPFADLPEGKIVITGPIDQEIPYTDDQGRPTGAVEHTLIIMGEIKIRGVVHGKSVALSPDTPPEIIDQAKRLLTAEIEHEYLR
jgi:hypothetical protein